jgi:hypothetical protein
MADLKKDHSGDSRNELDAADNDIRPQQRLEDFESGRTDIFGNQHRSGFINTIIDKSKPLIEKLFPNKDAQPASPVRSTEPATNGIYKGLNRAVDHPTAHGDAFFGVYLREKPEERHPFKASDENFEYTAPDAAGIRTPLIYLRPVEKSDLDVLRSSLMNPGFSMFSSEILRAVMNSLSETTPVTRQEFAKAFVDAIQTPQGATFTAAAALSLIATEPKDHHAPRFHEPVRSLYTEGEWLSQIGTGSTKEHYGGKFAVSAQIFRVDEFSKSPLTADEIKAIPALAGFYADAYQEVGQDHSAHALSVTNKLRDAGFPNVAANIAKRHGIEIKVEKRTKPISYDGGLGM